MNDDRDAQAEGKNAERRRRERDRAIRRRFESHLTPGLPVDADAPDMRIPVVHAGDAVSAILESLLKERNEFFEDVCRNWQTLFPGLAAKPGRFQNGRLTLYVASSATLFAIHPRLSRIRKALAALPSAPRRFSVGLEIHAPGKETP